MSSSLAEYFAGTGNFTLALADAFAEVVALEGDADAVPVGEALAEAAGAGNVSFRQADLTAPPRPLPQADVVLLDPPRTGARALCELLANGAARRIVYVSCDPACLARDLAALKVSENWEIASVDMVDLFPRTAHVETVVVLRRSSPAPT